MTSIALLRKQIEKPKAVSGPALKAFDYAVLDMETEAIDRRPEYPPKPVSVSLQMPGDRKPKFYAWGHPEGNNCTRDEAKARLKDLWKSDLPIVCQHGKFDLECVEKHFGLPLPPWDRCEDTEFLLFLHDPHASSLSLKPSAERILSIKPEEQDRLKDWILKNVKGAKPSNFGAFIAQAPASIVGPYANGDIFRTKKLFDHLLNEIHQRGMMNAYNRERRIMPIFLRNEQQGIRVDMDGLERDIKKYRRALETADAWLRRRLKAPTLNLDADKDVGDALDKQGIVTQWTWTAGGKGRAPQRSVSKANMTMDKFKDKQVGLVLGYRNRLTTCLSMFMEPWLEIAGRMGGTIHTEWNQVRQPGDRKGLKGTRTGRPSTNDPNFLNLSKSFEDKDDGYVHPTALVLPPLPLVRCYLLPDKGETWLHRDYNQQELRVLGHYEDGYLAQHYSEKPYRTPQGAMRFDVHSTVQKFFLEVVLLELSRRGTKIVNFSDIYGKGRTNLAESLGVDLETVDAIRAAKNQLMPGVAALTASIKARGQSGQPIRTWGGREYYAEPPMYVKKFKRVMDFYYKLLNYLVQGGSADITKEALIRYDAHPKRQGRFLVTVYDEINASSGGGDVNAEMRILREAMESVELDVPLLSDGKTGKSWGDIKNCWKQLSCERVEELKIERWW